MLPSPVVLTRAVPQIYANAERDASRRVLRHRFVIGTTLCRLFIPLYIWGCPQNVLFADTSRASFAPLVLR